MNNRKEHFFAQAARLRSSFTRLATGGDWAIGQPAETRRNLIWFWFDGLFAAAGDNINATYMVVYLLALGATQTQIGLLSSLSSLSAALMLLPGAMLVERLGRRRGIVIAGGGWSRSALLFLALLPFFLDGPFLITAAMALAISRDAMGNLSFPAWMSMTADIVPMEGRGRYFASRNFIMGIAGMTTIYLVGLLITSTAKPAGYQAALMISFVVGILAVFSFSRLTDRASIPGPLPVPAAKRPLKDRLAEIFAHREFVQFAAVTALWNFSLNIAGPFFSVYLVQNLNATATMIGLTTIASSLSSMLLQRKLGELNDRWGSRRLMMVSGLLIPFLPVMWVFINTAWQVIPANLAGGALWGAYNLAAFNYLLMVTPQEKRARYSAIFQIVVTISLAAGAAVGSLLIANWGYPAVFLGSGAGRMVAALLFLRLASQLARKPAAEPAGV